jgi:hypothetical protein
MKILLIFCATFLLALSAQSQQEARFHQVFEAKNIQKIAVKIDESQHSLNIKETYSSVVIVEVILQSNSKKSSELAEIARSGEYQLTPEIKKNILYLSPAKDRQSQFLPRPLKDDIQIIYNISVPEYVEF